MKRGVAVGGDNRTLQVCPPFVGDEDEAAQIADTIAAALDTVRAR